MRAKATANCKLQLQLQLQCERLSCAVLRCAATEANDRA